MKDEFNEPSLDKIDDYKGTETKEKRNTVRIVIIFCLIVGAIFAYLRNTNINDDKYIGSEKNIDINKK